MPRVHLNLGSNLGDRHHNLSRAYEVLLRELGSDIYNLRISNPVESAPWGFDSDNLFLNIGLSFDTQLPPEAVFDATRRAERTISPLSHRNPDGTYRDRYVDIDIIFYGQTVVDSDSLCLPHPRAHLRPFVLMPMIEIDPLWRHPLSGFMPAQMLCFLKSGK